MKSPPEEPPPGGQLQTVKHRRREAPQKSTDGLSFIHASLDDYGLSLAQFRIYCHVSRRAGRDGVCSAAVSKIGKACGLHSNTVRPALKFLVHRRLLAAAHRRGMTTHYRLAPVEGWNPSQKLGGATHHKNSYQTATVICEGTPTKKVEAKLLPEVSPWKGSPGGPRDRWKIESDIQSMDGQIQRLQEDRDLWTDQLGVKHREPEPRPEAKLKIASLRQRKKALLAELDALP